MTELSDLTLETFAGRVGDAFTLHAADRDVELSLAEVEAVPGGATKQAFSLVFTGPPEAGVPQGIHAVQHPELGSLEIFLVPISPTQLQAIFA